MTQENSPAPACLAPLPASAPVRFTPHAGGWDTHVHMIGLPEHYPMVANRHYDPPPVGVDDFIRMLDCAGLRYGLLVQVSVHGTDNRLVLEALRARPDRLRGVAVIDADTPDSDLAELKAAGVVGTRIQTVAGGGVGPEHIDAVAARCAELGWHLQLCLKGDEFPALMPKLLKLTIPFVIDHMGWFDIAKGFGGEGFQSVLHLARNADCMVKILGPFRRSAGSAPWTDTLPYARALIEAAPERMVWGSDWPHVGIFETGRLPQYGMLLDWLYETTSDPVLLRKILVENPARFYGLPPGAGRAAQPG